MLKKIFYYFSILLVVGYAIASMVYLSIQPYKVVCKKVVVNIDQPITRPLINGKQLLTQVENSYKKLEGTSFNQLKDHIITNLINRHELVKQARCIKQIDGTLRIEIATHNPILEVFGENNQHYFLDAEGFPITEEADYPLRLLVATGAIDSVFSCKYLYHLTKDINSSSYWKNRIEQIYVASNQDITLIDAQTTSPIFLGSIYNYNNKLKRLQHFYASVPKNKQSEYKEIDLSFANRVVCTRKKESTITK
ncbi:MAG: hypothetical protein WCQ82_08610 [Bacteroidaceae bacterium]|nr:hypothetical protein [Bacteroidaceae bacterium]